MGSALKLCSHGEPLKAGWCPACAAMRRSIAGLSPIEPEPMDAGTWLDRVVDGLLGGWR